MLLHGGPAPSASPGIGAHCADQTAAQGGPAQIHLHHWAKGPALSGTPTLPASRKIISALLSGYSPFRITCRLFFFSQKTSNDNSLHRVFKQVTNQEIFFPQQQTPKSLGSGEVDVTGLSSSEVRDGKSFVSRFVSCHSIQRPCISSLFSKTKERQAENQFSEGKEAV